MIVKNFPELQERLAAKYPSLATSLEFEIDEADYIRRLDNVRVQFPGLDDAHARAQTIYRIVTHVQKTSIEHLEANPESPTANTVIKAVDDLARSLRQNIGVLSGKTAVVEKAAQDGFDKASSAINAAALNLRGEVQRSALTLQSHIDEAFAVFRADLQSELDRKHATYVRDRRLFKRILIGIIAVLCILAAGIFTRSHAQTNVISRTQFVEGAAWTNVSSAHPFPVTCVSGCSGGGGGGGTSSNFGDAFPAAGTAAGFIDAGGDMAGGTLDAGGRLSVTGAGGTFPVTGTFLTDTQLRAAPVPVSLTSTTITGTVAATQSGTWTVQPGNTANSTAWLVTGTGGTFPVTGTFWQATQPVSGTFWQATQPVSGPLTDVQLRATPVPVSGTITGAGGTFPVTQSTSPWIVAGGGTAGSAATGVVTVQGISSMTPILATVSGTTTVTQGTGTNLHTVVDSGTITTVSSVTAIANALPAGNNNIGDVDIATFPDNEPFNLAQQGGIAVVPNPCQREAPLYVSINLTANTQIVTGTAAERIYICSFRITTATAQNIALVSGTGSVCATSTSGVDGFGGATAATGFNFSATGGIATGDGSSALGRTDTDGDNVCIFISGSGQVTGGFSYVSL